MDIYNKLLSYFSFSNEFDQPEGRYLMMSGVHFNILIYTLSPAVQDHTDPSRRPGPH